MIDHLSPPILNALADGELSPDQLSTANEHLAECPSCASNALYQSLLKSAVAKVGQRYTPPSDLQERLGRLARQDHASGALKRRATASPAWGGPGLYGWATACALLVVCVSVLVMQKGASHNAVSTAENLAVATEASDQHLAVLASTEPPQVISSDRHTVKPWFQGKLPFSFNLPENLAGGTTLDGANLTYLHHQAAAHLLYSIGKHRASVYLEQRIATEPSKKLTMDQSGFHVILFSTDEINGVAVSDVELSHLSDLVSKIAQAQKK